MSGAIHMTNRLSSSEVSHIFALQKQGITHRSICKRFDISKATLSRILEKSWIDMWVRAWGDPDVVEANHTQFQVGGVLPDPEPEQPAQQTLIRTSLLEQVRMFDSVKSDLHKGLGELRDRYGITTEFYNEMVDELLDELAEWKV